MEDGLGLSLSIEGLEKSPPPVASSPLKTTNSERLGVNNNSFLNKLDYFLKSPKQVTGSKTSQQAPYTKLNLGWFGGSSKPRQEAVGVRGTIKVSPPSDLSCSTAGKRSAAEISSTVDGGGEKKKLRLSKEQSTLLEQTFLDHSTLNNKQKLYLAKQLNLKPRQVEVWFQNRRARTKLKQTEVDCEFLRKYCEKLCDENKRLQRELHELRSPNSHRVLCHACKRSSTTTDGGGPHGAVAAFSRPVKPNVSGLFSNKLEYLAQAIDLI